MHFFKMGGGGVWLSLGTILIQLFRFPFFPPYYPSTSFNWTKTQMDYDYDANRNDRHSQDSKSSLPVKQYRRRAVRELLTTVDSIHLHYKHWCVQKY